MLTSFLFGIWYVESGKVKGLSFDNLLENICNGETIKILIQVTTGEIK